MPRKAIPTRVPPGQYGPCLRPRGWLSPEFPHSVLVLGLIFACVGRLFLIESPIRAAEPPRPMLRSVYPAGGQAGTTFVVAIDGTALEGPPFDGLAPKAPAAPAGATQAGSAATVNPATNNPATVNPATVNAATINAATGNAATVNAAQAAGSPNAPVSNPPASPAPLIPNAPRLWFADSRIIAIPRSAKTFEVSIPADVAAHRLDVRVIGRDGISGPRVFQVTPAAERVEQEPNETPAQATLVGTIASEATALEPSSMPVRALVVNGRMEKAGDVDCYRVACRAGQAVVFDLWADRIDSPLRGALEIVDAAGRRVASDRGRSASVDPRIDFLVPADGEYTVRVFDQTFLGGADYLYRLAIDAGPRVDFATPAVLPRDTRLIAANLWGRNLGGTAAESRRQAVVGAAGPLERVHGTLELAESGADWPPLRPSREAFVDVAAARWPSGLQPFAIPLNEHPVGEPLIGKLPIIEDGEGNHTAAKARTVAAPSDLAGRLEAADERDWYAFEARRGEVFWLEGFAERLGAPVDLELFILDAEGRELQHLADQPRNPLGPRFPIDTTDPAGRFTAPRDGSYYLVASNAIGGGAPDPRRRYWISFQREDADFRLAVVPHGNDPGAGLRAARGGRVMLDVLVHRRNGFTGPVRVVTENLPSGWNSESSWIGAGEDRGLLVVTTPATGAAELAVPQWLGVAKVFGRELRRRAATGAATRNGDPRGVARTTHGAPIASVGEAPLFIEADIETPIDTRRAALPLAPASNAPNATDTDDLEARLPTLFQDSVVEVRVDVRRGAGAEGPIELRAIGLPRGVRASFATVPPSENRGWLSLSITGEQVEGPFSFAIQADLLPFEATTAATSGRRSAKPPEYTTRSNLLSAKVAPGRIQMSIDPRTPRKIARGQVIHVRYAAERRHGFIGKIHTELAAPGGVRGIRGRGVTFTSQTETGEIQIIATENAPLGPIDGLRLEAIGTVEDQPTYLGGCLLDLEITE